MDLSRNVSSTICLTSRASFASRIWRCSLQLFACEEMRTHFSKTLARAISSGSASSAATCFFLFVPFLMTAGVSRHAAAAAGEIFSQSVEA